MLWTLLLGRHIASRGRRDGRSRRNHLSFRKSVGEWPCACPAARCSALCEPRVRQASVRARLAPPSAVAHGKVATVRLQMGLPQAGWLPSVLLLLLPLARHHPGCCPLARMSQKWTRRSREFRTGQRPVGSVPHQKVTLAGGQLALGLMPSPLLLCLPEDDERLAPRPAETGIAACHPGRSVGVWFALRRRLGGRAPQARLLL